MACSATKPGDRGREARRPREFPRAGWRDILLRTKDGITRDHVSIVAAGVAFYTMLALFPALAAAISIWGLLADPQEIQQQIAALGGMLPPDVVDIVRQQGEKVAAGAGGVTLAAAGGLLLALWSASRAANALRTARARSNRPLTSRVPGSAINVSRPQLSRNPMLMPMSPPWSV